MSIGRLCLVAAFVGCGGVYDVDGQDTIRVVAGQTITIIGVDPVPPAPIHHDTVFVSAVSPDSAWIVVGLVEGVAPALIAFRSGPTHEDRATCTPPEPAGTVTSVAHPCVREAQDREVWVSVIDQRVIGSVTVPGRQGGAPPPPPSPPPGPPPTPPPAPGDPELPRRLPTRPSQSFTYTVRLPAGGNLSQAIAIAQPSTQILLAPGATYSGPFVVPIGQGCLRIATDLAGPAQPDTTFNYATLTTSSSFATVNPQGDCLTLELLEITSDQGRQENLVSVEGPTSNHQPDRILVTRSWLHAKPGNGVKRAVKMNGSNVAVVDNWITNIQHVRDQAQGAAAWNAVGPLEFSDNYVSYKSQGFMCGGSGNVRFHPADITVRRNHFVALGPRVPGVHLAGVETKDCHRMLVEANVFDGGEFTFLFKSSSQGAQNGCSAPIAGDPRLVGCGTDNLTARHNRARGFRNGLSVPSSSGRTPVVLTHDVLIENNLFEDFGPSAPGGDWSGNSNSKGMQILGNPDRLTLRGLTFRSNTGTWVNFDNPKTPSPSLFMDNIVVDGTARFLDAANPSFAAHYSVTALGDVFGGCAGNRPPRIPINCSAMIPSGAGANEALIAQMTAGVER